MFRLSKYTIECVDELDVNKINICKCVKKGFATKIVKYNKYGYLLICWDGYNGIILEIYLRYKWCGYVLNNTKKPYFTRKEIIKNHVF